MAEADASISIGADGKAFSKEMKAIAKNTDTMANSATARLARVGQALSGLQAMCGAVAGGFGMVAVGLGKIGDLATKSIVAAASAEQLQLSFRVLLNSEESALDFMQRLNSYAAETPFSLNSIADAAKTLLANTDMGADETIGVIRRLGNVSAMSNKDLNELARNYAKVFNSGMDNEVAKSFEEAGLPVRKLVADIKRISFAEAKKQISEGAYGIAHLNAALESATGAGGKLNGATKQLSTTFNGLASTLSDNVNQAFQRLGEGLLPAIKPSMDKMIEAVQAAFPLFEALGDKLGEKLGGKVEDVVIPAIQEMVLWLPELADKLELAVVKADKFLEWALAVPNALRSITSFASDAADALGLYAAADAVQSNSKAFRPGAKGKAQGKADPEKEIRLRARQRREALQAMMKESAARADMRRAEARQRDEQRKAELAEAAEQKKLDDARLAAEMKKAEAADKAAAAAKKAAEEQLEAEKRAADARARIEADEARRQRARAAANLARQSLARHEKGLQAAAASLGVQGPVTEKSLTARIAELNGKGGYADEIARLQELRDQWEQLAERKKTYRDPRLAEGAELRAQALELAGNRRAAAKVREEEEMRKRITELTGQGMGKSEAQRQAKAESKLRRLQALQQESSGPEFIQESRAHLGNGGVSIRIDGQLAALKQGNKLLNDIHSLLCVRLSAGRGAAVLS